MVLEALALFALGVVVLLTAFGRLLDRSGPPESERPVLPSHYSSLLYFDRRYYPGHCPGCGTDNEPGYRYCEQCGDRIPTSGDRATGPDVRQIFDEQ